MLKKILVATLLFAAGTQAHADRSLMADFGDNYVSDGQNWDPATNKFGVTPGTIPFALDFGTGAVTNRTATPNSFGGVVFLSGGSPTGDFINVALSTTAYAPTSAIEQGTGKIDRSYVDNVAPNFGNPAAALDAYRYLWNFVCRPSDAGCVGFQFEADFVVLGPEAFVLQFNYGDTSTGTSDPIIPNITIGYSLGANTATFLTNGAFNGNANDGPAICFNNGVASRFSSTTACLNGTVTTTVPEPDVASLFLLGGLGLASFAFARRRRPVRIVAR